MMAANEHEAGVQSKDISSATVIKPIFSNPSSLDSCSIVYVGDLGGLSQIVSPFSELL